MHRWLNRRRSWRKPVDREPRLSLGEFDAVCAVLTPYPALLMLLLLLIRLWSMPRRSTPDPLADALDGQVVNQS